MQLQKVKGFSVSDSTEPYSKCKRLMHAACLQRFALLIKSKTTKHTNKQKNLQHTDVHFPKTMFKLPNFTYSLKAMQRQLAKVKLLISHNMEN